MNIPRYFCWTRFGTEAAQTIEQILQRKEAERRAGNGVFVWGIGNAVGRSMLELLRVCDEPTVLFSPIKSAPKAHDVNPPAVAAWTGARGLFGEPFVLPDQALVTSRFDPSSSKRTHYALVCYSEKPLELLESNGSIQFRGLRNLISNRPVGPSQVTAVVEYAGERSDGCTQYGVAMRARLVAPYFIRLRQPIPLNESTGRESRNFDFQAARTAIAGCRMADLEDQGELAFA